MGKTPTPLVVWVAQEWAARPAVVALAEKGHQIVPIRVSGGDIVSMGICPIPDLILHPAAHWWDDKMWDKPAYLDAAMKAARKRKKSV